MSHYAHLNPFSEVDQVIVAEADFIAAQPDPQNWIQTSYNTIGGVHVDPVTLQPDGGTPIRMNYAGLGYTWDGIGFSAPQPYPSWTKDPTTYLWNAPVPYPTDGKAYAWFEPNKSWVAVTATEETE